MVSALFICWYRYLDGNRTYERRLEGRLGVVTHPIIILLILFDCLFPTSILRSLDLSPHLGFRCRKSIPTFIIKRVYNKDVLGYSGELYFFVWAKKHLSLKDKDILFTIKDNNIISSVASTVVSVGLLSIFFFTGQVPIDEWFTADQLVYWISGIVFALVLFIVLYRFRNYVIHMSWRTAFSIFGIQMLRLLVVQVLNLLMFYVVMPETPMYVWFTYLSIEIILSRIPFLPNKDFIFVSLSISLAGNLDVSESAIAGLMLTRSVLGKILNFIFFAVFSFFKPKDIEELDKDEIPSIV